MFACDYKTLSLTFNDFHDVADKNMPEYGDYCLLELKDGRFTGGSWHPSQYPKKTAKGQFIRGTADTVDADEVARWHALECYDLTRNLEDPDVGNIDIELKEEGRPSVKFSGFKSTRDGDCPEEDQYCLIILLNGRVASGRWNKFREKNEGTFIYAPALGQYTSEKVWAWTPLSSDYFFEIEQERKNERIREEELNKNPSLDENKFKYGKDIFAYYEKALEKLRKKYPWVSMAQMMKNTPWDIVPLHGQYVFGQKSKTYDGYDMVTECKKGNSTEEFIKFLCEYAEDTVKRSNPEERFKFGHDIEVYLEKAYGKVKKDYHWFDKKMLKKARSYAIKQIDGDWEFVEKYKGDSKEYICECESAERFIENVEYEYQNIALSENPVVSEYKVSFKSIEIHGWYLEHYIFYKLKSGDYKVDVQAGDRVTGGSRTFFITPYCFEAKTYDEFLDRYLEIVPGSSFGLGKEELYKNDKLKSFLGY